MSQVQSIAVVGAGPVGVFAALACARRGHSVTIVEAETRVDDGPRAATTHPSTLEMIAGVGLIEDYIRNGLVARHFQFWDGVRRELVAEFDFDRLRDETPYPFVVQLEQHKLVNMGLGRLRGMANAKVMTGTRLTGFTQDANAVQLTVEGADGRETFAARYLIAADGGRSTVRKALDVEFEGYTWPERFLVITTLADLQTISPCCYRNYVMHPQYWFASFKVSGDDGKGRWRVTSALPAGETDERALSPESIRRRMVQFGLAEAVDGVIHLNVYHVHQRVAKSFRKGRVFLVGDAAHVNNPLGGLGLNSGVHEATDLANLLDAVLTGRADESVLDQYERRRRALNIQYVQEQTTANKRRIEEKDPAKRAERLCELRDIAADPAGHRAFVSHAGLLDSVKQAATMT